MQVSLSKKAMSITASPTLAIDAKFKEMLANGIDVVGFGAGEPDFDTPQNIKDAAILAINKGYTKYTPAAGLVPLRKSICTKLARDNGLSYDPSEIVVSNGAKHSLVNAFAAICNPGDEVIIHAPFWVSYPDMVRMGDGVPVILHTTEQSRFKFTIEQLASAITPKTKALVLNSPSNPTGMLYNEDELRAIAKLCVEKNIFVVSDEIYEKLIYDGKSHVSIASFGSDIKDLTIVVNGLSKSYAMTGWRIGYTACNAKIAKIMGNMQSHATSNPNTIAQYAAIEALDGTQAGIAPMVAEFEKRRNYMVERINVVPGASCLSPDGAFYVMMNITKVLEKEICGKLVTTSDEFCELLLDRALVALVPGSGFGMEGYVRWSYATSLDNIRRGVDRLEQFLKDAK